MVHIPVYVLIILCSCAMAAFPAIAQTHEGSLRGAVRDATGVVSGAHVVLRNEETFVERTTQTNDVWRVRVSQPAARDLRAARLDSWLQGAREIPACKSARAIS